MHELFEWDEAKAAENLRKHRVSFEEAVRVLSQPEGNRRLLQFEDDRKDYGEVRVVTLAPDPESPRQRYHITWTARGEDGEQTRIITARKPKPKERRFYERNHFPG